MFICVSVWIYVHHMPVGTQGGQRLLGSLELELQVFVNHLIWILGTKPGFSARAVNVLKHWAISSVPIWFLLMHCPDTGDRCAHILALEKEFNSSASFKGGLQWRTHRWFIKYPENQTGSHFFPLIAIVIFSLGTNV